MSKIVSSRLAYLFRLISVNFQVLVGFWMTALFLLSVGADVARIGKDWLPRAADERASLPTYEDPDLAAQIYRDQNRNKREHMPFTGWRSKPLTSETVNIDENGFRIHSVGKDNTPGAKMIGFFGGSAMWGTGADDNNTIPALFDLRTSDYEVRNYAEQGWVSRQNVAQLINEVNQHRAPDVAAFYDGYNDVRILCNRAFTESLNGTSLEGRFRAIINRRKTGGHLYRNLALPFVERLASQHRGDPSAQYICDKDPGMAEQVAEVFVQNWLIAAGIVESYGGTFIGFLQPSVFGGDPRLDHLPENVNADWRNREAVQRQFDSVYPIIRGKLDRSGLAWKDLADALDGDEYYYVDTSHVAPRGNILIESQISDFIEISVGEARTPDDRR